MRYWRPVAGVLVLGLITAGCALVATSARGAADARQRFFYEVVPFDVDEIVVVDPRSRATVYRIREPGMFAELDGILEFNSQDGPTTHECLGEADIHFLVNGRAKGSWHFAHGTFFVGGWVSAETDRRLAAWFASKGVKEFSEWVGREQAAGFDMPRRIPDASQPLDGGPRVP